MSGRAVIFSRGAEVVVDPHIEASVGALDKQKAKDLWVLKNGLLDQRLWPCAIIDAGLPEAEGEKPTVTVLVPPGEWPSGGIECRLPHGVRRAEVDVNEERRALFVCFEGEFSAEIRRELQPRVVIGCSADETNLCVDVEARWSNSRAQEMRARLFVRRLAGHRGRVFCEVLKAPKDGLVMFLDGIPDDPFPYPHALLYFAYKQEEVSEAFRFPWNSAGGVVRWAL